MHKYLEKNGDVTFDKIFNQKLGKFYYTSLVSKAIFYYNFLGFLTFRDFCENVCDESVPQLKFYEEVQVIIVLYFYNFYQFFILDKAL